MMNYTVSLSFSQDTLLLDLTGYTVTIPNSAAGMNILFRVLRAEKQSGKHEIVKMNTTARPTQDMIDNWLKENKVTKSLDDQFVDFDELNLTELGL